LDARTGCGAGGFESGLQRLEHLMQRDTDVSPCRSHGPGEIGAAHSSAAGRAAAWEGEESGEAEDGLSCRRAAPAYRLASRAARNHNRRGEARS